MTLPTQADYQAIAERLHAENTLLKIERAQLNTRIDIMRERIERLYANKMQQPDYLHTVAGRIWDEIADKTRQDVLVTVYDENPLHMDARNQAG